MYKLSIFLFIIMMMSCGVTTYTTNTDDLYFSPPTNYYSPYVNNYPRIYYNYYQPYQNGFMPFDYPHTRQYIYILPKENNKEPRRYNLNLDKPKEDNRNIKQNSTPIRTFPKTKN